MTSKIRKIDSKYSKDYGQTKKDKINKKNQDYWNRYKNKSIQNPAPTNIN